MGKVRSIYKLTSILSLFGVFFVSLTGCKTIDDALNGIIFNDRIVKYDYAEQSINGETISVSKGTINNKTFVLEERGIIFNKSSLGKITSISFNIKETDASAKLYLGTTPLGFDDVYTLQSGHNTISSIKDRNCFLLQ